MNTAVMKILTLNSILLGSAFCAISAHAATNFSDFGTLATATSQTITPTAPLVEGGTANFLAAVASDPNIVWSGGGPTGENNNPTNVSDYSVSITVGSLVGSGSLSLLPNTTGLGSIDLLTTGDVESFTLDVLFLNSSGDPLTLTGRDFTSSDNGNGGNGNTFGPIGHVVNLSSVDFNLGIGVLDTTGNLITGQDYLQGVDGGAAESIAPTTNADLNGGLEFFEFDSTTGDTANVHRFNDSTPGDNEDERFSGVTFEFNSTDADDAFDEGTRFNLSFDSQIVAIPEPSGTALLGLGASLLLLKRKRS